MKLTLEFYKDKATNREMIYICGDDVTKGVIYPYYKAEGNIGGQVIQWLETYSPNPVSDSEPNQNLIGKYMLSFFVDDEPVRINLFMGPLEAALNLADAFDIPEFEACDEEDSLVTEVVNPENLAVIYWANNNGDCGTDYTDENYDPAIRALVARHMD